MTVSIVVQPRGNAQINIPGGRGAQVLETEWRPRCQSMAHIYKIPNNENKIKKSGWIHEVI